MREIPLTQGKVAIVSDEDYPYLSQFKWHAHRHKNGQKFYASRTRRNDLGEKRSLLMHRDIINPPPHTLSGGGIEIDHINGDSLDNRRENLRMVTKLENYRNRSKTTKPTSSRYKGVTLVKKSGLWHAYIRSNDLMYHLGNYATEEDAARAYDAKAREMFGEFGRLNLPDLPPIPVPAVTHTAKGTTGYVRKGGTRSNS